MIIVMGTVRVPVENIAAIRPMMAKVIAATLKEDGCIQYAYGQDVLDPELIHIAEKWRDIPADEARRAVALGLRDELRDLFDELGGLHLQIGKYYPYREIMNNEALGELVAGVKAVVDPERLMNPGALGL